METSFSKVAEEFIRFPNEKTGFAVIINSKHFILKQVSTWKCDSLTPAQKIQELMTEMFLILMEDFDANKITQPAGILSYLSLRLRRLTRPYKTKAMNFGLSSDFEDLGRINFTHKKVGTINEIVKIVREALASEQKEKTALLEFMFIHIFPELAWTSRLIAKKHNISEKKQIEADKKRHQTFNKSLRLKLQNLETIDWKEILNWSFGERSHLAWRIIQITPTEIGINNTNLLSKIEEIRENLNTKSDQNISYLELAKTTIELLKVNFSKVYKTTQMQEEAACYGKGEEEVDVLNLLICPSVHLAQKSSVMNKATDYSSNQDIDLAFDQISSDIQTWLEDFLKQDENNKDKQIKVKSDRMT